MPECSLGMKQVVTVNNTQEYSSGCADVSDDQIMIMLDHHGQNPIHMVPQVYHHEGVVGTPEKRTSRLKVCQ